MVYPYSSDGSASHYGYEGSGHYGSGARNPSNRPPGWSSQYPNGPAPGGHPYGMHAHGPGGSFQPGPMPDFNMNASVIRMGVPSRNSRDARPSSRHGSNAEPLGGGNRRGLGHGDRADPTDKPRGGKRNNVLLNQSFEETRRTIFVLNLDEFGATDEQMYRILNAANGVRHYARLMGAKDKPSPFAYAEYATADAVKIMMDILPGAHLPKKVDQNSTTQNQGADTNGDVAMEGAADGNAEGPSSHESNGDGNAEATQEVYLKFKVDEKTHEFMAMYHSSSADPARMEAEVQLGREQLEKILREILDPPAGLPEATIQPQIDQHTGEIVNVPINFTPDDDLSHVPDHLREQVRVEISGFRKNADSRETDRKRVDATLLADVRARQAAKVDNTNNADGTKAASSAPPATPRGPRGDPPSGPRGKKASTRSNNGNPPNIDAYGLRPITKEELESDLPDEEIERRRQQDRKDREHEEFLQYEREYLAREKQRLQSMERERIAEEKKKAEHEAIVARNKDFYLNWDGNVDVGPGQRYRDFYYRKSEWLAKMKERRDREIKADREDELQEAAEAGLTVEDDGAAKNEATKKTEAPRERVQLALGAAAKRVKEREEQAEKALRGVENLLDTNDNDRGPLRLRRMLEEDGPEPVATETSAAKLAASIPQDKGPLFAWKVQYDHVSEDMVVNKLRPYVEKQVIKEIGASEDFLIDTIIHGIEQKSSPDSIRDKIFAAINGAEESDAMVMSTWRLLIFLTEAEKLGIDMD